MKPDVAVAREHVALLTGSENSVVTIQCYTDCKEELKKIKEEQKNNGVKRLFDPRAKILNGPIAKLWPEIEDRNLSGSGIFITLNETNGAKRRNLDVKEARVLACDDDAHTIGSSHIACSFSINSARGPHLYWRLDKSIGVEKFREMQKRISAHLKTDKSINDPARVLRSGGTLHLKDPKKPYFVTVGQKSGAVFTIEQMETMFPNSRKNNDSDFKSEDSIALFNNWVASLPAQESDRNPIGGRNCTVVIIAREGLGLGLPLGAIEMAIRDYCRRSGLELEEGLDVLVRQERTHRIKPFISKYIKSESKNGSYLKMANTFSRQVLGDGTQINSKLMSDDIYMYENGIYKMQPRKSLKLEIVSYFQKAGTQLSTEVIQNVLAQTEGLIYQRQPIPPGSYSGSKYEFETFIPMKNGILLIPKDYAVENIKLVPHSPDFFSLSKVPYEYDPNAKCPTFDKIVDESLPAEVRSFLEEWFGYQLIYNTSMGKAVIYLGEGSNSKSVIATVQGQLIGEENFTSIGIDAFDPARTFNLAATEGKLANICEDMNEVNKVAEGLLKSFITGGRLTVERKHRDPKTIFPTARLTFATNTLPRFSDSTDGIFRRLIILPFTIQILDERKQNKNFINPLWWRESGELPGVLNLALKGLERLMRRGHFIEPSISVNAKLSFRTESNSARQFLTEFYEETSENEILFSANLYEDYVDFCKNNGFQSMGANKFASELRRLFKSVKRSSSMRKDISTGRRGFFWSGIRAISLDETKGNF